MDKFRNIAVIKYFFSRCLNLDVDVQYSTVENAYLIGFDDYTLEDDNWAYSIFPYKDKILKWSWETHYESDGFIPTDKDNGFNRFRDCLGSVIKYHLEINLDNSKQMEMLGYFDE